ncbi:hypothetical protein PV11_09204 [Exophiala sideris]|uniref:Uncharacterized protein n=1 Tax=Exophiala sideris TaxID=1016849 RepID=A0A0D1Y3K5_9EURO|nr:hypothetical protein PV11_09204 [Exophiala sideris]
MSKSGSEHWESSAFFEEPVPTYEESVAISAATRKILPSSEKSNTSVSSLFRQGRTRRILDLTSDIILPTISVDLASGCAHITLVIVPSDTLESGSKLDEQNIVTPGRQDHERSRSVLVLQGQDNRTSFWMQNAVVRELDLLLRKELGCPSPSSDEPLPIELTKLGSPSQSLLPSQREPASANGELPPRPKRRLWLKRSAADTEPESDPTGETGKWNLGWRVPETPGGKGPPSGSQDALQGYRTRASDLKADQVALHTRTQDVSFRTEDRMGLFQTTTVKCIWLEIDVGT